MHFVHNDCAENVFASVVGRDLSAAIRHTILTHPNSKNNIEKNVVGRIMIEKYILEEIAAGKYRQSFLIASIYITIVIHNLVCRWTIIIRYTVSTYIYLHYEL